MEKRILVIEDMIEEIDTSHQRIHMVGPMTPATWVAEDGLDGHQ